jgi:rod shape-determining protein MreD
MVMCGAAILQSALLPHLSILGVKADLVLLLAVAWSIRRGIEDGLVVAILGGIALDLLSAGPVGSSVVAVGVACVLAGAVGPTLRRASVLLPLLLAPLTSVVATLLGALIMVILGWQLSWPSTVALVVLPSALLDSLAMLIVYPVVSFVDARVSSTDWPG